MRDIEPLAEFTRRIPEHGRIRFGVKGDKGQPQAIDTFRFTSTDKTALELLAAKYGGNVRPWSPGRGRTEFEVLTAASEIDVVVPPNALGGTPVYELRSGGGLTRRCDGAICMAPVKTKDGVELAEQSCVCDKQGRMECKPVTRVSVLIPDIPFNGTWRLEAKGWNAAHELPGMIEMVGQLTSRGLARATLALEKRTSTSGGQTHHFIVPVVKVPVTLEEILGGGATLRSLSASTSDRPVLEAGENRDDVVVDAEVVEDDPDVVERRKINRLVLELGLSTPDLAGFVFVVTEGQGLGLRDLALAELLRITTVLEKLKAGELVFQGLQGHRAVVTRPESAA